MQVTLDDVRFAAALKTEAEDRWRAGDVAAVEDVCDFETCLGMMKTKAREHGARMMEVEEAARQGHGIQAIREKRYDGERCPYRELLTEKSREESKAADRVLKPEYQAVADRVKARLALAA